MTKVLLIEDNLEHTKLISRVLVASGYAVLAAKNAKMGLRLAIGHHPDIILLDLGLPDLDGATLLGQIRHVPELTDVPVVAVTAWPPGTNPQLVENAGFDGYLSKPLEYSSLGAQIATYLHPDAG